MLKRYFTFLAFFIIALSTVSFAEITGGNQIYNVSINGTDYTIHVFTSNGYFNTTQTLSDVDILAVGGGGSGGAFVAGGGGAGGLVIGYGYTINPNNYEITIGQGGAGVSGGAGTQGNNGTNTTISILNISALGGGGGGGTGKDGGSGGGGGYYNRTGGSSLLGQGNDGGTPTDGGAGGGGAGTAGETTASVYKGGQGGNGTQLDINGSATYYAGGGGGACAGDCHNGIGYGGLGGGGNGERQGAGLPAQNATANTGGGGGGTWTTNPSGNGGSGIIVIRYVIPSEEDYVLVNPISPSNNTLTNNKTTTFQYNITTNSSTNVSLYLDATLINHTIITENSSLSYTHNATYGAHSWYIYAEKTDNTSINATSDTLNFEVYFNVSLNSPPDNINISGNTATLSYSTLNLYPIVCNLTIDSAVQDSRTVNSSSTQSISFSNLSDGSNLWYVVCYGADNLTYSKTSDSRTFHINYQTLTQTLNLTNAPENVLTTPQAIFYDIDGNLNVLYFKDNEVVIKKIISNQVNLSLEANLPATKSFMVALRNQLNNTLLTFSQDNTTMHYIDWDNSTILIHNASTTYNAAANNYFDAYTYAYTKQYESIDYTNDSYYLFILPANSSSYVMRYNLTDQSLTQINVSASRLLPMQTIAKNQNLSDWYFSLPVSDTFRLYEYDGTTQTQLWYNTTALNQTEVEKSVIVFENYEGATYFGQFNQTNRALIHLVEENQTAYLPYNISNPSHFYFIDNRTFVFFSREADDTYAYSCYFTNVSTCNRFSSNAYGAYVTYERGTMVSAKRQDGKDVVVKGLISSAEVVQLLYNQNTYDIKFICYDEQIETRKSFTVQIYTNTSANALSSPIWGYVLPSELIGEGLTKAYSICQNGTQRLYVIGLAGNYTADFYSLNLTEGAYYTFVLNDKYGQDLQGVKLSAYRFSIDKQAWVVIEQGITDFSGSAVFFLEPFNLYKFTIELAGYLTLEFDFVPAGITTIEISLSGESDQPLQLPDFYYLWQDVSYSLAPNNQTTFNESIDFTYQVSSQNSTLQYFGMEVIREYNNTQTLVYSNNLTSSPSGGTLNYTASQNGTYIVNTWLKAENQTLFTPISSRYSIKPTTLGFLQARDFFNANQPISGWGFYFIGVVATMVVVGFVSQYTIDGAGLAGLAVLWGFTLFNPNVSLVCVGGLDAACITPLIATTLTSVVVLAGLYVKNNTV